MIPTPPSCSLSGISHFGASLGVWGMGGAGLTFTPNSAELRRIRAAPWTTQGAVAWCFLTLDPVTPFAIGDSGTFRGLPSTYTGTGLPGFSVVTPMVITNLSDYLARNNARGIARLKVTFVPEPSSWVLLLVGGLALAVAGTRRRG